MRALIALWLLMAASVAASAESSSITTTTADGGPPPVVMYTASWCPYCARARDYLKRHGVEFDERDIEASVDAAVEYESMGAVGVPVLLIGEHRMDGFRPARFWDLYEERG